MFRTLRVEDKTANAPDSASFVVAADGSGPDSRDVAPKKSRGPRQEIFRLLTHGTVDCTFTSWTLTVQRDKSGESDDEEEAAVNAAASVDAEGAEAAR